MRQGSTDTKRKQKHIIFVKAVLSILVHPLPPTSEAKKKKKKKKKKQKPIKKKKKKNPSNLYKKFHEFPRGYTG